MTWAQVLATGSGKTGFRLVVEGLSREFVTDSTMERTTADGRLRSVGLKRESIVLGSGSGIIDGKLKSDGLAARIADVNCAATEQFATAPTLTTFATADISTTSTALNVVSTSGWPTTGRIHIGTECCTYSGVTATSFTGLVRGVRDTIAQAHYSALTTTASRRTEVTNRHVTVEGRRAYLYAYGDGDDPQGNGALVFRGVVSRDASLEGPAEWSLTIDGMSRVLEQDFVGPSNGAVPARGIYYSWASPLQVVLQQTTGASINDTNDPARSASFSFTGFFETQDEFCTALRAACAAAMPGWETSIDIVSQGEDGWYPVINVGATARFLKCSFTSIIDRHFNSANFISNFVVFSSSVFTPVTIGAVTANTSYILQGTDSPVTSGSFGTAVINRLNAAPGSVPRGTITSAATLFPSISDSATWPENRIYIQPDAGMLGATQTLVQSDDGNIPAARLTLDPGLASASQNYVVFTSPIAAMLPFSGGAMTLSAQTETMQTAPADEAFGSGLVSLISWLLALSPSRCNLGGIPLLTSADFDPAWKSQIQAAQRGRVIATQRRYYAPRKGKFLDYLAEECKLIGVFPALNANGQIKFVPVQLRAATEAPAFTLDASTVLTGEQWPGYERSAMGTLNEVVIKTKYDPNEDKHVGTSFNVRDVTAYSRSKMPRTLEIAPRSQEAYPDAFDPFEEYIDLAGAVLGIFGRPYVTVDVAVPWSRYSVTPGDLVTITNAQLPNTIGTRGVSNVQGVVLSKRFAANDAHGLVTLLVHGQNIAGYTPTGRVASQVNVSGNTWDITLSASPPAGFATASSFADFDSVRVWSDDTATTTSVAGTVVSVTGNVVRVAFVAAWTPSTTTWNLGFNTSVNVDGDGRQGRWTFVARSTGIINYLVTTSPGRTFAP